MAFAVYLSLFDFETFKLYKTIILNIIVNKFHCYLLILLGSLFYDYVLIIIM